MCNTNCCNMMLAVEPSAARKRPAAVMAPTHGATGLVAAGVATGVPRAAGKWVCVTLWDGFLRMDVCNSFQGLKFVPVDVNSNIAYGVCVV